MNRDSINLLEIKRKNKEVIFNIALSINKELFDEDKISYKIYKKVEKNILNEIDKNL